MNLQYLRTFCTVAETRSFTAAAERLHLTQPAVSQHVKLLEAELDTPLLVRTTREVRLTPGGKLAYRYGTKILPLVERAVERIRQAGYDRAASTLVGVSLSLGEHFLPRFIGPLTERSNGTTIELTVAPSHVVAHRVAVGDVDLGVIEGEAPNPRLSARLLLENELILVASPDHPLSGRGSLTIQELGHLPLILRSPGSHVRESLDRAFASHVGGKPAARLLLASNQGVKAAILSGLGPGFLSRITVLQELEQGRLVHVSVPGFVVPRPILLLTRRGQPQHPLVPELVELFSALSVHGAS